MLLYIHIPFCDSKCHYCAFNSYTHLHALRLDYMHALFEQLKHDIAFFKVKPQSIETLFIGGGTPSTVAPKLYAPLFEYLKPYLKDDAEISSEANPNSATFEWLQGMYDLGVNRISFGTQSFDQDKLTFLNRAHSAEDTIRAVKEAQSIGYKNLSIDLIYGTQVDTQELLQKDLETAFTLPINHLSAYALTIEEGTHFQTMPQVAQEHLETTRWLFKEIEAKGFKQYEISNFGSYQSLHNRGYWEYKPYLGIGAGAVGRIDTIRYYPHNEVQSYIDAPFFKKKEILSASDMTTERILLGLRSGVGIDYNDLSLAQQQRADILIREGKLSLFKGLLTNPDYLLADALALFLED